MIAQRHVDGDLLAAAHEQEVDVLERAADGVALHGLGQREFGATLEALEQQEDVRALERAHEFVARQADVARRRAVAVQDGGNAVVAADATGGTLTEL